MTLFHFGNCIALAYAPYFMTYKFSGLAEYGVFWKCIQAGAMYLFTQLCKMLALATFFPATEVSSIGRIETLTEFLKNTVDVADLIGLHIVMTKFAGKGETKFLVAGLGWASAELLMTRLVPLWVGARSVEFDWKYLQMSFDSNISLVHHITTATLVWLWSRHDLRKTHLPIVMVLLAAGCYRPLIIELFTTILGLGAWAILAVKAASAVSIGLVSMHIYFSITQGLNSY
ncbi:LOW QUALITY PROTEIN: BOS complex subunit TMEM147-like [Uloborus diversus]|uniref:LOW QUALITY PROTEIN: BOS complex subunit TMEM147-like n=1 Tax=Uloborus diversus TaxID=327109 RepID=UPI00240A4736|nr:LOW QUALITY PROTEIN: BOS complex subunit TMEM147-like [Uloborus diversus]